MATDEPEPPDADAIVADLKELRRRGIVQLTNIAAPALRRAVHASGRIEPETKVTAYMVETMLRDAVPRIGGDAADATALLLGLAEGARSDSPVELRRAAHEMMSKCSDNHWRQYWEKQFFGQIAQILLGDIHTHQLRQAQLRRDVRTPVGSRLAVEWLTRFEAMYRIWTPVTGIGNDLTAYRSTLFEPARPWDRAANPDDTDDDSYTQERQAAGYVTAALFHHTAALVAERRFSIEFGGLWLLSDAQAETDIADAMHRIRLATPNNERDDSYLRGLLTDDVAGELHQFLEAVGADPIAMAIHNEWQAWTATCVCTWAPGDRHGREPFPTHLNHPNIDPNCDVHQLIAACGDYCLILGEAWDQIADWYHDVPVPTRTDTTAEEIYTLRQSPLPPHLKNPATPD